LRSDRVGTYLANGPDFVSEWGEGCETRHRLLDSVVVAAYHQVNRFRMDAIGVPVPRTIVPSRMLVDESPDSGALNAGFDVAIVIIGGIILLTGGT
jgi:hypothetical protein